MLMLSRTTSLSIRVLATRIAGARNYSKDYDSSDDEKESKTKQNKPKDAKKAETQSKTTTGAAVDATEEPAITRLNRLLASMPTENTFALPNKKNNVTLPRPGDAHKKRKEESKKELESKDIFVAAKRVASLAGDGEQNQQIESELLAKLLGHKQDEKDVEVTDATNKANPELSLSELIVGMKIDRSQPPKELTRGEFVRRSIAAKTKPHQQGQQTTNVRKERKREAATYTGSVNLFGSEPLGIFKNATELRDVPDILSTWAHLQQNELKLLVTHPPANYFEKLALWTEQGKVWRFPIDNEQDLSDEAEVDFSEHIFLEQHLEPWCPEKGPIRHYMELVCVGLSKNPYITAKEKKEHILWYRDYFEAKKDILRDLISQEQKPKASGEQKKLSS
ncbi:28S ribosomal protein S31, mitochondrial [Zeugodacus cucurbitae]|uniref:28S ribosomal protein S31, mitochondrial n=1 Tax=Zeugodacus cucurbitae TaxID=28588 RepID=UPI0023D92EDC|nr:28S ribosomal protein S31, mitochondrial [Zeugodacus cucurbitae]